MPKKFTLNVFPLSPPGQPNPEFKLFYTGPGDEVWFSLYMPTAEWKRLGEPTSLEVTL